MLLSTHGLARCDVCGVAWDEHTSSCINHRHKPEKGAVSDAIPVLVGVNKERGLNLILCGDRYFVEPAPGTQMKPENVLAFNKV